MRVLFLFFDTSLHYSPEESRSEIRKHVEDCFSQIINLIKINAKTHRQFIKFLDELRLNDGINAFYSDLSLHCDIR